ncbi:MAG TPA: Uma2 family endonuclease [Thermoanaerobaculia bacterium]
MAVALLDEIPLTPSLALGPYRLSDYEALPLEPRCELLAGRFYLTPSPSVLHQVVAPLLWKALDGVAGKTGGIALPAPLDVVLADHSVVQPDVIYLAAGRRGLATERIEAAPDLLVEVLSPGTARRDRGLKLHLYARSGIREYWIVDPLERQIEFLVQDGDAFRIELPQGGTYRSRVLPGVHLNVPAFWRSVDRRLG